ncbi:MAG: SPASM domain-containing protein [bacterium]
MKSVNIKHSRYYPSRYEGFVEGSLGHLKREVICEKHPVRFPLMLNIEPTSACNLSCYVCTRGKSQKAVGYMDWALYTKLIDEIGDHEPLYMLNLHKDGEPLLHPKLPQMIQTAKEKGVSKVIHFNTNGVLLCGDRARELLDSGIDDITVSIDAAREETFQKIKGKSLLSTVERNVEEFLSLREKRGYSSPFLRVKIMEFSDTEDEIEEFIDKWEGVADEVQVSGIHNWGGGIHGVKQSIAIPGERFPCVFLWYALAINWNGGVSLCCVDWRQSDTAGNLNDQTLQAIWQGEQMKKIRSAHIDKRWADVPACHHCFNWAGGEDISDWAEQQTEFYK